jgi:hypothetical protein
MSTWGFEARERHGAAAPSWAAICVAAILLALASAPAAAQAPPYGSIGLYVDDARSFSTVAYAGPYTEFTMYVFAKPGTRGMSWIEYAVKYPTNVLATDVTTSPLISLELGTLDQGVTAIFQDCQNDWVWTHRQLMYLRDTNPSRIEIVKNALSGAYQAGICDLGYSSESLFITSRVSLNSASEPDTTAPVITGAENITYSSLKLTFSEPLLLEAAENTSNYEVVDYGDPTFAPVTSQAELWSDGVTVDLYIAQPLTLGRTYLIRVHGLYDLWGNEISPTTELLFTAGESGGPKIKLISSEGDSVLYVDFSRSMAPGPAANPANYVIYCGHYDPANPQDNHCTAQPHKAALVTQMRARLAFSAFRPPVETQLRLKVNNLTDIAGNPVASPYDMAFFIVIDPYPPTIWSVTMVGRNVIRVLFDEVLRDSTANVPGNYTIWKQADTTATVPVIGAQITTDKRSVTLSLGANLSPGVPYVLRARGILDTRGNRMPAWYAFDFVANDIWPPKALSAVALSRTLIRLTFDEQLDSISARAAQNYSVYETARSSMTVPVATASLEPGRNAVRLALGGTLGYDVGYTVCAAHVKDLSGNAMAKSCLTTLYPDTLPPSVTSVTGESQRKIDLVFDMKLNAATAELAANYALFESGDPARATTVLAATLSSDQMGVTLSLGASLVAGRSYTIAMSNLTDIKGHRIAPQTAFTFTFVDTSPPSLQRADAAGPATVLAHFSEPLDNLTAENTTCYSITRSSPPGGTVAVSSALLIGDSSVVQLSLGASLGSGGDFLLHVTGVRDRALNPVPKNTQVLISTTNSLPPTYSAFVETYNRVYVLFNQPVTEPTAGNPANYSLIAITSPCDTVAPAAVEYLSQAVRLSFATALIQGHIYALRVANVAGLDGKVVAPGSEYRFICTLNSNGGGIGLYSDAYHYDNTCDRWADEITMYVCCKPGPYGLSEVQFSLSYPSGVYPDLVVPNGAVVQTWAGDPWEWSAATLSQCASDWVWICRHTCFVMNHSYTTISINSGLGSPLFTTCAEGHPTQTPNVICGLELSDVIYIATQLRDFSASYRDGAVELAWRLSRLDEGARMIVSRAEAGSPNYQELAGEIGREDLAFSYSDNLAEPGKSYHYRVEYTDGAVRRSLFETQAVAVPVLPMALNQNWPNPFNPVTTITYYLPHAAAARLDVYDVSGRRISCLESGWKEGGKHSVRWDGKDESGRPAAAGIYLYRLTVGKETLSRKMILLR